MKSPQEEAWWRLQPACYVLSMGSHVAIGNTRAMLGCLGLLCVACGTAPYPPATHPTERAALQAGHAQAGAISVALRVTLDAPPDAEHVHLHAITYNLDGDEMATDLGGYIGTVTAEPLAADDLVRVMITHAGGHRTIRLVHREGQILAEEIHPENPGESPTLIERITLPPGAPVRPNDTPLEQPR